MQLMQSNTFKARMKQDSDFSTQLEFSLEICSLLSHFCLCFSSHEPCAWAISLPVSAARRLPRATKREQLFRQKITKQIKLIGLVSFIYSVSFFVLLFYNLFLNLGEHFGDQENALVASNQRNLRKEKWREKC